VEVETVRAAIVVDAGTVYQFIAIEALDAGKGSILEGKAREAGLLSIVGTWVTKARLKIFIVVYEVRAVGACVLVWCESHSCEISVIVILIQNEEDIVSSRERSNTGVSKIFWDWVISPWEQSSISYELRLTSYIIDTVSILNGIDFP
jgi:hypothetical protein